MIFVDQAFLHRAIAQYVAHYHEERNHQGLANRLMGAMPADAANDPDIRRRSRPGGMLSDYRLFAA